MSFDEIKDSDLDRMSVRKVLEYLSGCSKVSRIDDEHIKNTMITIFRKTGWMLNPNDKVVNAILKRCELNNGECPCDNPGETREDRLCPCKEYRENDVCHCTLYIKDDEDK